jgi:UDP-N-acetylglucosamine 1-carboxyvinyltransferase
MSVFLIRGNRPLSGSVKIHGAKNSVLPILAATILNAGVNVIHNCPKLKDVEASVGILKHLGCSIREDGDMLIVDSSTMTRCDIPDSLMREMRSSVIFLGAVLARTGQAVMSFPGGCELGPRPIDLHLNALRELGAEIESEGGNIFCRTGTLQGREITLSFPSVGATENIMIAATAARGITRIQNAAREPEIEDLQNFLQAAGAYVSGAGSSVIVIEGGQPLHEVHHTVIYDRIVAATYLCAAASASGSVTVGPVNPNHLSTIISVIKESGCDIDSGSDFVTVKRSRPLSGMKPIRTMPYPGFPTDAQAPVMAVAAQARGTTVFVENIFENRYRHVGELNRMGADIRVEGRVAVVCGVPKLTGGSACATDLRGGAAIVIAALGAQGESRVSGLNHIDRGYEHLEEHLRGLGADIRRLGDA